MADSAIETGKILEGFRSSLEGRGPMSGGPFSEKSIKLYMNDASLFLAYLTEREIPLSSCNPDHLINFFQERKYDLSTALRHVASLTGRNGLFASLERECGIIRPFKRTDLPEYLLCPHGRPTSIEDYKKLIGGIVDSRKGYPRSRDALVAILIRRTGAKICNLIVANEDSFSIERQGSASEARFVYKDVERVFAPEIYEADVLARYHEELASFKHERGKYLEPPLIVNKKGERFDSDSNNLKERIRGHCRRLVIKPPISERSLRAAYWQEAKTYPNIPVFGPNTISQVVNTISKNVSDIVQK